MWIVSEIAAMATDLAEFVGGAIGLSLLFDLALLLAMAITGTLVLAILLFERYGFRPVELIIGSLVAVIGLCYLIQMFIVPVDWGSAALHTVLPQLTDSGALGTGRRHYWRDGHAACDLSAFRSDASTDTGSQ
jgi:manganese transport protein